MQEHRGWVSDEALADVAALLGDDADELDGVATFYNLIFRRPVGRHVILVCDSVSCWIMGDERMLRSTWSARSASSSARRRPTAASRSCPIAASAPATRRRHDDRRASFYGDLDTRSASTRSSRDYELTHPGEGASATERAPLTGDIRADGRPLDLDEYDAAGGYQALRKALRDMAPAEVHAGGEGRGPARPRRRGLPHRPEVELRADGRRTRRRASTWSATPTRWSRARSRTAS